MSDLSHEIDNIQTRFISGGSPPINQCNAELLVQALDNLKNHFITWGIVEKYEESLILFKHKLNWPQYPAYHQLNMTPPQNKVFKISPELISQIETRNQWDMALYQWAKEKFEEALKALGNLEVDIHILRTASDYFKDTFNQGYKEGHAKGFQEGKETGYKLMYERFPVLKFVKSIKNLITSHKPK